VPTRPTSLRDRVCRNGGALVEIGDRLVLALVPGPGVVTTHLVMTGIDRLTDVTVHPAAARATLLDAATRSGVAHEGAQQSARAALHTVADLAGAWQAPPDAPLTVALGGAGYPLLAAAYADGAAPLEEVPRWAASPLAERSARAAATTAFARAASRPVVRALATSLTRGRDDGAPVHLGGLALALMGADILGSDRLARVLDAPGPPTPPPALPPRATIELARRTMRRWGTVRTERVLSDAAANPDGHRLLSDTIRYARDLGDDAPPRLPQGLVELHDRLRARVRTDPGPPAAARDRHPTARRNPIFAPPVVPAAALVAVTTATRIPHRPEVTGLAGASSGDLHIVLPQTCGDLVRWSRILGNCLNDFGPAAVSGRSTILGIERNGELTYAVELRPANVVRQFTGRANRPPNDRDRAAVIELLTRTGTVDREHPDNRPWCT